MADERLALGTISGVGWSVSDIQVIAREAEAAGFDAIFAAEVNNDVMATALLMGLATQRIQVGTWVANTYLRHPYVCAQGAALIAEATGFQGEIRFDASQPDGQPRRKLDTSRALNLFGWRATTSFQDGLRATVDWYRTVRTPPASMYTPATR